MPSEIVKYGDEGVTFERDMKVVDLLCAGVSSAEVANKENITVEEVERSLIRITGAVSPAIKERHFRLVLSRMERLHRAHYVKSLKGDYDSSVICLRTNDFVARLLGLFPPPQTAGSPLDDARDIETTTDKIRAALDRVCGTTPPVIDGEATQVDDDHG